MSWIPSTSINNVSLMEVKSKRIAAHLSGTDRGPPSAGPLSIKWIIEAAARRRQTLPGRLSDELINAYNNEGDAIATKINVTNGRSQQAFAHFGFRSQIERNQSSSSQTRSDIKSNGFYFPFGMRQGNNEEPSRTEPNKLFLI